MSGSFDITKSGIKGNLSGYKQIEAALRSNIAEIERIKTGLNGVSFGTVKLALGRTLAKERAALESLKNLDSSLETIIRLYENAENTIVSMGAGNGVSNAKVTAAARSVLSNLQAAMGSSADAVKAMEENSRGEDCTCSLYGGDPVNFSTGNFIFDREYLSMKGRYPISFRIFYNSLDREGSPLGVGWVHNYYIHLERLKDFLTLHWSDGRIDTFLRSDDGNYRHFLDTNRFLRITEYGYLYSDPLGIRYYFDKSGRNTGMADENDNKLFLEYEDEKLISVKSSSGEELTFEYNSDGRIRMVSDHTKRCIQMEYSDERLCAVTDEDGNTFRFGYDENGYLSEVINGRKICTIRNEYDAKGRVLKQTFPDGGELALVYEDSTGILRVTEQNGNQVLHYHDELKRLVGSAYSDGTMIYEYNSLNQKTRIVDKKGNATQYFYDGSGNLTKVENALGETTEMRYNRRHQIEEMSLCGNPFFRNTFDAKGNLVERLDGLGRKTQLEYDAAGNVNKIIQPDGSEIHLKYDTHGNMVQMTDPQGRTLGYEYDALGQVTAAIDGRGNRTEFTYNQQGYITAVKNAEGDVREYTYNEAAKVTKMKDFDGSCVLREYNAINKPERVTDKEGRVTRFEYNQMYRLSRRIEQNGAEFRFEYDLPGRLKKIINPNGAFMEYEYDSNGNQTGVTDSQGHTVSMEYDALNRMVLFKDPDGSVTTVKYNYMGQQCEVTDPMGHVRTCEYDLAGQKVRATDISGNEMSYTYNELGLLSGYTDAAGRTTRMEYYPGGLLKRVINPDGTWCLYEYDANRNVVKKTEQNGYSFRFFYDCLNRLIRVESNEGQVKSYTYDAAGNVISMKDGLGAEIRYRYSPSGKLMAVTDAVGNETEYRYDEMGWLSDVYQRENRELTEALELNQRRCIHSAHYERNQMGQIICSADALGNAEYFSYDPDGKLLEKTDRDGITTRYGYTAGGMLDEIEYEDEKSVKLSYNPLKQLTEIRDWIGSITLEVDALGRPEKITDPDGTEMTYERGVMGERRIVRDSKGKEVRYDYDDLLRVTGVTENGKSIFYGYNENGDLCSRVLPNGIRTEYAYTLSGQLSSLSHTDEQGVMDRFCHAYDFAGNRIQTEAYRRDMDSESGVFHYGYDLNHRLRIVYKDDAEIRQYGYDGFGNRSWMETEGIRTEYTYNEANQLLRETEEGPEGSDPYNRFYQYDRRGNMTAIYEKEKLKQCFSYNKMNRLESMINSNGQASVYAYNGIGHRVGEKSFHGEPEFLMGGNFGEMAPDHEVRRVLDLTRSFHNLLSETRDGERRDYTWMGELSAEKRDHTVYYYLQDERGSILRCTDENGRICGSYGYDEFGKERYKKGEEVLFGFSGYYKEGSPDLYYVQAREYLPGMGRFGACDLKDPVQEFTASLNAYCYCWNNPLGLVDCDGMWPNSPKVASATKEIFNGAANLWNQTPKALQKAVSSGGKAVLHMAREVCEADLPIYSYNPGSGSFQYTGGLSLSDMWQGMTISPVGEMVLDWFSFERTPDGVFHTRPDCWQAPFGYNDFYDYVFDGFTSCERNKVNFTYQGREYTIWMWKGDYLNLGAGCETGIYYSDDGGYHKYSATDSNLKQAIVLYDKRTGRRILAYEPNNPQWWITGFNPRYQDVDVKNLEVRGMIDFSKNPGMFDAFYRQNRYAKGWCFDVKNKIAYYTW